MGRSTPFRNLGGWDLNSDERVNVLRRKQALMYARWTKAASVSLICKINIHELDCIERGIICKPGLNRSHK